MPDALPIHRITTYVLRIPRDFGNAIGGAGTPSELRSSGNRFTQAAAYGTLYSQEIEAFLIKIEAGNLVGWGESQAPIAPEICATILEHVVGPWLIGQDANDPAGIYQSLYEAMSVRGHWNGFYPDALAGADLALWDIAGKAQGKPVSKMLSSSATASVPTYVSGVAGRTLEEQVAFATRMAAKGAQAFKIFWTADFEQGLELMRQLRATLPPKTELFVDVLWRLTLNEAIYYAAELAQLHVGWLEAPLPPEQIELHSELNRASAIPIAIGESYRCHYDFDRFIRTGAASVLQPDLGRCGITLTHQIAEMCSDAGLRFAPHVSISLGPQLAAAMHVSAAAPSLWHMEINPQISSVAQKFLETPLTIGVADATVPTEPGLGITVNEAAVRKLATLVGTIS